MGFPGFLARSLCGSSAFMQIKLEEKGQHAKGDGQEEPGEGGLAVFLCKDNTKDARKKVAEDKGCPEHGCGKFSPELG